MNTLPNLTHKMIRSLFGLSLLIGLMFSLFEPRVEAAPPTGNAVESVETTTLPNGQVMVRVNLKNALSGTPAGFTVGNPPRIALDLPDTGNSMGKNTLEANLGPLNSVNVVQAGTRTRLVLNLNKAASYETQLVGKTLLVSLGDVGSSASSVNATPRFAEAISSNSRHTIRDVDFRRGDAGEARIVTTLSDAQAGINIRQQANGLVVDFIGTDIPKALQRRLDVADFGTPVQIVESYTLGDNTRMVIQPKGGWEYSAYQTDNNFIVEVKPSSDAQKKTADGKPSYVGEKLSLNFQNVEVRSVLQVIADFTGMNIVASDSVTGSLTLRLKDVPWDQALDLIMQTKGLDKRQNGNVIWVAPKDELMAREKQELEFRQSRLSTEIVQTLDIPLNYLRASAAVDVLTGGGGFGATGKAGEATCDAQAQGIQGNTQESGGRDRDRNSTTRSTTEGKASTTSYNNSVLSIQGSAAFEAQSNTVIVTDVPSKLEAIRTLLAKLDVPTRQVMIEARVVVATDGWSRDLGARLSFTAAGNLGQKKVLGGPLQLSGSGTGPLSGAPNFALSLLNVGNGNLLNLELLALEADSKGKVISNPRVMTSNQKPAVILNGTQIPYITPGTANSPPTVTFKDAFLCLLVDPQILNNDSVIMTVEVQKDAVRFISGINNPAIDTKRIKTQVRVNNGETLVLGGIFDGSQDTTVSKVPFLGDVPVLGNLFKTTTKENSKTELIIFLTPRIIDERLSLR
ncbi:MAG: type IV pilus secretin PilQ [Thiobacillus sp.]